MASTRFAIWDKELDNFFIALAEQVEPTDIASMKEWFSQAGPRLIYKSEESTIFDYIKRFIETNKRYPDLSGVGLAGYMIQVLKKVIEAFFDEFHDIDNETNQILELQFAKFILAAFCNHDEFYEWRAQLSTTRLFNFVKANKNPNLEAQNNFIATEIVKAINNQENSDAFRNDLRNYLEYTQQLNEQLTPLTKMRGMYIERSHSSSRHTQFSPTPSPNVVGRQLQQTRDRFGTSTPSPPSIHRLLSAIKTSSSRAIEDKGSEQTTDLPSPPRLGLKLNAD